MEFRSTGPISTKTVLAVDLDGANYTGKIRRVLRFFHPVRSYVSAFWPADEHTAARVQPSDEEIPCIRIPKTCRQARKAVLVLVSVAF